MRPLCGWGPSTDPHACMAAASLTVFCFFPNQLKLCQLAEDARDGDPLQHSAPLAFTDFTVFAFLFRNFHAYV